MPPSAIVSVINNFWIVLILVTVLNALMLKARAQKVITRQPELRAGYDLLFKGYLIIMNIPWLIIGFGMIFGGLPGIFSFFRPRDGNPFVLAFHASVVMLWLLGIWWIFFKDGAEFLVRHPGVLNHDIQSPTMIKLFFAMTLVGGMFGMGFMWSW